MAQLFLWMSSEFLALTRSSSDKGAHLLREGTKNYSQSYHEEEVVQSMSPFLASSVFMKNDSLGTFRIVGEYYYSHSSTKAA